MLIKYTLFFPIQGKCIISLVEIKSEIYIKGHLFQYTAAWEENICVVCSNTVFQ